MRIVDEEGRFKTIEDEDRYYGTMDKDGNIVISPSMGFRVLGRFYDDIAVAAIDTPTGLRYGLVNDKGEPICDFRYTFLEDWGEGYYRASYSSKYNIVRRDGTEVLKDRYSHLSKVRHGLVIAGNTIPKTKETPTRYTYAVIRVDGETIVPEGKYDLIRRVDRYIAKNEGLELVGFYAETLDCCYLLDFDGSELNLVDWENPLDDSDDTFPWEDVKYTICHNCIFRDTILPNQGGCSQLEKRAFRKTIIHDWFIGLKDIACQYKKTSLDDRSLKEYREEQEMLRLMKENDTFAIDLINDFVNEKLQGDIDKLPYYDFSAPLRQPHYGVEPEEKYFADSNSAKDTPIVKAILSLVFKDAWNELNYQAFEQLKYRTCLVNPFVSLFGARIAENNYKAVSQFGLSPELCRRIESVFTLHQTIGNMLVLPNKHDATYDNLAFYLERGSRIRGYMDKFLIELDDAFAQPRYADAGMVQLVRKCKKELLRYSRYPGFTLMCRRLMLDDFLGDDGKPRKIFDGIYCGSRKQPTEDEYRHAIPQYLQFCENFIPRRGQRITERLKEILNQAANQ